MSFIDYNRVFVLVVLLVPHTPLRLIERHLAVKILVDDLFDVPLGVHLLGYPLKYVVDALFDFGVLPVVVAPYLDDLPS